MYNFDEQSEMYIEYFLKTQYHAKTLSNRKSSISNSHTILRALFVLSGCECGERTLIAQVCDLLTWRTHV